MKRSIPLLAFALAACAQEEGNSAIETESPETTSAEVQQALPTVADVMAKVTDDDWREFDQEDLLYFELERGTVVVALSPTMAKTHTAQMRALAREGFYDGLSFYRVIDGFVAQGGDVFEKREVKNAEKALRALFDEPARDNIHFDPMGVADGYAATVGFIDSFPAGYDPKDERFWLLHCTGAMAMARGNEADTGATEIYITLQPQRYLDRNLTVFGKVVDGMEHVQALRRVTPAQEEGDDLGETILSVRVGADLPVEKQRQLRILRSDTPVFSELVDARKNRGSDFFFYRPDYVDVCQMPVPISPVPEATSE